MRKRGTSATVLVQYNKNNNNNESEASCNRQTETETETEKLPECLEAKMRTRQSRMTPPEEVEEEEGEKSTSSSSTSSPPHPNTHRTPNQSQALPAIAHGQSTYSKQTNSEEEDFSLWSNLNSQSVSIISVDLSFFDHH